MDCQTIIEIFLIFMAFVAGMILSHLAHTFTRVSGTLKIDSSDPEKDHYMFEIDDLDSLSSKSEIVLKIEHVLDLSQD